MAAIGATPGEIVFTSGGTEADNLALRGVHKARRAERNGFVTVATEHHADPEQDHADTTSLCGNCRSLPVVTGSCEKVGRG